MKNICNLFISFLFFSFSLMKPVEDDTKKSNWTTEWNGIHKEEIIYGKNITGFNKFDRADEIFVWRGTTDLNFIGTYNALQRYADPDSGFLKDSFIIESTIRSRIPRGMVNNLIKTTPKTVKVDGIVFGEHQHSISRHFLWIRSAYTEINIGSLFGLDLSNNHTITLGMFPYQLDPQGIALGDAYAVSPNGDFMGEGDSSDVDQFACGILLSDEIIKEKFFSEIYIALLQNKSGSLSETNERVLGHLYGHQADPARKFGSFNYVIAAKLIWQPLKKTKNGSLSFIPFGLFNNDREQKIEFTGDARSKLGTFGCAVEYAIQNFEASIQAAFNCGNQQVFGIDRNEIVLQNNSQGSLESYNNSVYITNPSDDTITTQLLLPYVPGSADQSIVSGSLEAALNNGKQIGVTTEDGTPIFNGLKRYRDSYKNVYKGWMALFEGAYWFCDKKLRLAVMAGITTGDLNPNAVLQDGDYKGFIGLQELYSGNRVKSAFFLGGGGRPRRPLSVATDAQAPDRFLKNASNVGGFTNLRLIGASLLWTSVCPKKRPFKINPNVVAFWQDYPTGGASPYLGTEINLFLSTNIYQSLELFGVFALFVPGKHYTDRKNKPLLTSDQIVFIDQVDTTGFTAEIVPGISDNVGYSANCGFKISF